MKVLLRFSRAKRLIYALKRKILQESGITHSIVKLETVTLVVLGLTLIFFAFIPRKTY